MLVGGGLRRPRPKLRCSVIGEEDVLDTKKLALLISHGYASKVYMHIRIDLSPHSSAVSVSVYSCSAYVSPRICISLQFCFCLQFSAV